MLFPGEKKNYLIMFKKLNDKVNTIIFVAAGRDFVTFFR